MVLKRVLSTLQCHESLWSKCWAKDLDDLLWQKPLTRYVGVGTIALPHINSTSLINHWYHVWYCEWIKYNTLKSFVKQFGIISIASKGFINITSLYWWLQIVQQCTMGVWLVINQNWFVIRTILVIVNIMVKQKKTSRYHTLFRWYYDCLEYCAFNMWFSCKYIDTHPNNTIVFQAFDYYSLTKLCSTYIDINETLQSMVGCSCL